jgi:hypothetical protein
MSTSHINPNAAKAVADDASSDGSGVSGADFSDTRRPYLAPKLLSAEPLELAAATCDPATGGFGKVGPPTCVTDGS